MSIIQMLIAQMFSGEDVGDIGHSLRFRGSQYLNRTFGTPTDRRKFTLSQWVKTDALATQKGLFDAYYGSSDWATLQLTNEYKLQVYIVDGGTDYSVETVAVFRDPSSWLHVGFVYDSANVVAADRLIIYVNGVRQSVTNTYGVLPLNHQSLFNSVYSHKLGLRSDNSLYLNGYLSRVCFVDGQALTPSSFGYFNTNINEWVSNSQSQVKAVVDAGGTNSFMLDFDDGTSTTTLGYDKSSKGNNWTCNNISLTAGTTYDHMLDVPGNSFATLNPLDKGTTTIITVADGNLDISSNYTSGNYGSCRGTMRVSTGQYYFESTLYRPSTGSNSFAVGFTNTTGDLSNKSFYTAGTAGPFLGLGATNDSTAYYKFPDSTTGTSLVTVAAQGDVVSIAADFSAGKAWFGKNGQYWNASGTLGAFDASSPTITFSPAGNYYAPCFETTASNSPTSNRSGQRANFGQRPFSYTPPTGFLALNQANLSASGTVIISGSFTGNASTDGPFIWMNGVPDTLTINGNAVTFGTHADKLANGFKLRTSSASYNVAGSNTWTATITSDTKNIFKYNTAEGNP